MNTQNRQWSYPRGQGLQHWHRLRALSVLAVVVLGPAALGDTIVAMEYFIDNDPGPGQAIPIPAADGAYNSAREAGEVAVDTTALKPGPHMVYVRARSSNGVWGTYPPVLLYVYQRTGVVEAKYYIDTDPGVGKGEPLEAADGWFDYIHERLVASVSTAGLAAGSHTLYVRARNSAGLWGPAQAVPFRVQRAATVAAAECGLGRATDTEPTFETYPMLAEDFVFNATMENLIKNGVRCPSEAGPYRVFVRAKNDRDMWGPWAYADLLAGDGTLEQWLRPSGTGPADIPGGALPPDK